MTGPGGGCIIGGGRASSAAKAPAGGMIEAIKAAKIALCMLIPHLLRSRRVVKANEGFQRMTKRRLISRPAKPAPADSAFC
jgi:hypothetical protein